MTGKIVVVFHGIDSDEYCVAGFFNGNKLDESLLFTNTNCYPYENALMAAFAELSAEKCEKIQIKYLDEWISYDDLYDLLVSSWE